MPRFYCLRPLAVGMRFDLPAGLAHHVRVLRLAPAAHLTLFNGEGGEHIATIEAMNRNGVQVEIKAFFPREAELSYAITLAQALPEGAKMDWIVEKAVELGATALQPLATQRCVARLSGERAHRRVQHWNAITVAAAQQCGRNRLMHVSDIVEFSSYVGQHDLHVRIMLTPAADVTLSQWARHHPPQALTLMIGPEGGFNPAEASQAAARGVLPLSMGPRILRTETAGLVAIAGLNAVWGET
ncbi:MAG: 16S rRNA (uracil(1498)-N(3))-methyltransferase [Burkholderiaceae bacterium]